MPLNNIFQPQQQQLLATGTVVPTANMATTTYPFSYTTFTNTSPQPFTKPTILPTGMFSFGPVMSCSANSIAPSASARPSGAPIDVVQGTKAGCIITNSQDESTHAFWDLYCCKSRNITAVGKPLPCSAQCSVGDDQTWQDLGSCLSKRNTIVVCKPDNSEIGSVNPAAASKSSGAAPSGSSSGAGTSAGGASATGGAKPSVATGGASSVDVVHATFSKAGVFVFALMAVTSAAGMFL